MNSGKTVFSQIMQLIPRREFNEIVTSYNGDYRVRNLSCHDQFLVMCIEIGAIYLMDRGYVDFFRLFNNIHKNGAFFVTMAKDNMQYEVVSSRAVDSQTGVISDRIIRLTTVNSNYFETSNLNGTVVK
ncbi:DUF4372 domain-containing protein [Proteiniphilum propionicum]|uniref:DUF4372 domain-containing protein n=1 Tax=Proteiniphilum propionicum TaxID=2829812 RepID=UPI0038999BFC